LPDRFVARFGVRCLLRYQGAEVVTKRCLIVLAVVVAYLVGFVSSRHVAVKKIASDAFQCGYMVGHKAGIESLGESK